MARPWAGLLRPILRRDLSEIERRASAFHIHTDDGRRLVSRLGVAFLGGYNAMLGPGTLTDVAAEGRRVEPHFRPFFFEGAAMGYLARTYLDSGFGLRRAERDLLEMDPAFRYLYYVGLGFWYGIRHGGRPSSLRALAGHVDPIYLPLCYDGLGFKVGFFDYPRRPSARRRLDRCPPEHLAAVRQGFGRALFFVFMDDEPGFENEKENHPVERRGDLEFGRALALGFTQVHRPEALVRHIVDAGPERLGPRLTGLTWALTARAMNDPVYFQSCLAGAPEGPRAFLGRLPGLCGEAFAASRTYADWQARTRVSVEGAYAEAERSLGGGKDYPSTGIEAEPDNSLDTVRGSGY